MKRFEKPSCSQSCPRSSSFSFFFKRPFFGCYGSVLYTDMILSVAPPARSNLYGWKAKQLTGPTRWPIKLLWCYIQ